MMSFDASLENDVRGLGDLDAFSRHRVSIAGEDEAFEQTCPVIFHCSSHRRRCFAGTDDDCAATCRLGQEIGHTKRRLCSRDRGFEDVLQQAFDVRVRYLQRRRPAA
jgi:hypothetical protein